MPDAPESWGTMPLDDLLELLYRTTLLLSSQYQEVGMDEAAYHRAFWTHWQRLPAEDMSIAAMNRECELECRVLREAWILSLSLLEGYKAKRDSLVAVVASRSN